MKHYTAPSAEWLSLNGSDVILSSGYTTDGTTMPNGFSEGTPTVIAAPTSWWE